MSNKLKVNSSYRGEIFKNINDKNSWLIDSLGCDGKRELLHDTILNFNINGMTYNQLLKAIGSPNTHVEEKEREILGYFIVSNCDSTNLSNSAILYIYLYRGICSQSALFME
jgi:hypothetical protein